jgi:predicted CXXCH cytochrome family protein
LTLSGPSDRLKTPTQTIQVGNFFDPQVTVATVANDGYSGAAVFVPPALFIFLPFLWDSPVSDTVTLVIPADAVGGTYVAAIKARREWGGEALNRAATISVPVGPAPTEFIASTGGCNSCHAGATSFANVLHGVSDRRACFACHASLAIEPDTALDIRVHMVHSRSARFTAVGGSIQSCSLCHVTPPAGPLRNSGVDGL